ncbi:double-stranded RNA-binding protein 4-like [Oryza brachyantha]|uniref:double-stranded RNA-binding protein 4-like n=1 Tax=Oryza brachyantha TaxID=4533 RepID=UPI0003EABB8A|nr:double-stranded RNA-binding protein 4-like [Oryza brachyantha]
MADTAAAAASGQASSEAPAPLPPPPHHCNYKNLLQELLQQANKRLPIYSTKCKGEHHQPKFKSTVTVEDEQFSSASCHRRVKDAEKDAAKVAYDILVKRKESDDVNVTDVFRLIDQDVVFSKSILHEFAIKTKAAQPSYSVLKKEELSPVTPYVASVSFAGSTYTGGASRSKKDAEQKAARAAVKSILATKNACMAQIIRSKENLITTNTPSVYKEERGAANQEINSNPTNKGLPFVPIIFTAPVIYESYGGPGDIVPVSQPISSSPVAVQEHNIMPAADPASNPSAQAVHVSKKHKNNRISEPGPKEERVAQ